MPDRREYQARYYQDHRPELVDQARERSRRRRAVVLLRVVAAEAAYASEQMADGLSPEQARDAALEMAAELEEAAGKLRAAVRLRSPGQRRTMARLWAGQGMPTKRIAAAAGVTVRQVQKYLRD
jgi:hypothetical protein